jgi:hypothetical protein
MVLQSKNKKYIYKVLLMVLYINMYGFTDVLRAEIESAFAICGAVLGVVLSLYDAVDAVIMLSDTAVYGSGTYPIPNRSYNT